MGHLIVLLEGWFATCAFKDLFSLNDFPHNEHAKSAHLHPNNEYDLPIIPGYSSGGRRQGSFDAFLFDIHNMAKFVFFSPIIRKILKVTR